MKNMGRGKFKDFWKVVSDKTSKTLTLPTL